MQVNSEPSDQPALPNLPPLPNRRVACTHTTLTRVYGSFTCTVCCRPSDFGWVYRCSQDTVKDLIWTKGPNANTGDDTCGIETRMEDLNEADGKDCDWCEASDFRLSAWVEAAILEGHYTSDQVGVLKSQRQNVASCLTVVEKTLEGCHDSLPATVSVSPSSAQADHRPASISVADVHKLTKTRKGLLGKKPKNGSPETGTQWLNREAPTMFSGCTYQCCQSCRPVFRDRAWLRFDDVFNDPHNPQLLDFETDNRPISDARIVQRLGLLNSRPSFRTFESMCFRPTEHEYGDFVLYETVDTETNGDAAELELERRRPLLVPSSSGLGFRESVRHAFRTIGSSQRYSSRIRDSRDTVISPRQIMAKRENRLRKKAQREAAEHDPGLPTSAGQEELSRTESRGEDGESIPQVKVSGEVIVEDGVAVTEEAVNLGAADIIMQV